MNDPAARLEIVRPAVPVDLEGAVLAESWSNDTWLAGGSVLRVCRQGDRDRLVREATLLRALPAAVPHASVQSLAIARDLGSPLEEARALEGIGRACLHDGNPGETAADLQQALTIYQRIGAPGARRVQETLNHHGL